MAEKSEISPSLAIILPKDLLFENHPLPRLKNTSIGKLQWIELIKQYYPQVFEAIKREDYTKIYKMAFYRPDMQLDFELLESTVENFFKKYKQPPPYKKYVAVLVKMPVPKSTEKKIGESIKIYYGNVLLTNGHAPSVQDEEIHSPPPARSREPFLPPPPRPRTPGGPPQLKLPKLLPMKKENETAEACDVSRKDRITVKLLNQYGHKTLIKMKMDDEFFKVMNVYSQRHNLPVHTVRFLCNGRRISPTDTARQLDITENDSIEIYERQTGGAAT